MAAHREVHPAPDHQRHRRAPAADLRRRLNVRDWIHADDHSSAVLAILERAGSARPTWSAPTASSNNLDVVRLILGTSAAPRTTSRWSPTAPGTTCATRSSRASSARSWAGSRGTPTSTPGWPDHRVVPRARGLVAAAQGRHRGGVRREGPVRRGLTLETTPIPGLLVLRLDLHRGRPRLVRGGLAAREDGRARAPRLRAGAGQPRVQRRRGTTRGIHAEPWDKLVTVVDRPGRSARGSTSARAMPSARSSSDELDPGSRCSCPAASATATRRSTTATPTPTWSTTTGDPAYVYPALRPRRPRRGHPVADPARRRRIVSDKDRSTPPSPTSTPMRPRRRSSSAATASSAGRWSRRSPTRAVDIDELDLTDPAAVDAGRGASTTLVLNAAAYTAVDAAETPRRAAGRWAANAQAPGAPGPARRPAPAHARALLQRLRLRRHADRRTPRPSRSRRWASTARPRPPATSPSRPPAPLRACGRRGWSATAATSCAPCSGWPAEGARPGRRRPGRPADLRRRARARDPAPARHRRGVRHYHVHRLRAGHDLGRRGAPGLPAVAAATPTTSRPVTHRGVRRRSGPGAAAAPAACSSLAKLEATGFDARGRRDRDGACARYLAQRRSGSGP